MQPETEEADRNSLLLPMTGQRVDFFVSGLMPVVVKITSG
jgi:hypothetical protein